MDGLCVLHRTYTVRICGQKTNGESDHHVGETLQSESRHHEGAAAGALDEPEGEGRRDHVGCRVCTCQNTG